MLSPSRPVVPRLEVLLLALVLVGLSLPAAKAASAPPPHVGGVVAAGEEWSNARLKVRWSGISGATYQVRWATSSSRLSSAKIYPSRVNAATSPTLRTRCVPWYVQVRAVRSGQVGSWSAAKTLRFSMGTPGVPALTYSTASQTSESAAQVRWRGTRYAARYRLDWSAAPYGLWAGFAHNYTPWRGATSRSASVALPAAPAVGDHFLAPAYGNPVFAQLQYDNGCSPTYRKTQHFAVFPKARTPKAGDTLAIGSYNLEGAPTASSVKVANIASNIAERGLDVVALQEATDDSARGVVTRLAAAGQGAWARYGVGAQQIIWRTSAWQRIVGSESDVGQPADDTAATPLRTPGIRLTPATGVASPQRQDIFVVSLHLEDRIKFDTGATIAERKRDAQMSAKSLLAGIAQANVDGVPTLAAGDYKGTFGGGGSPTGAGYCDENQSCPGEGQPTFVRAGFWDAQTAVTKAGLPYGTVNKHDPTPPAAASGIGGRADFILARGTGAFIYYRNVVKSYGDASATYQPDHNLLFARVVIPRLP